MKVTNKLHRVMSIIIGVIMLHGYQGAERSALLIPLISASLAPLLGAMPTLLMGVTFTVPVREQISAVH